ncbi:hypothetical protein OR221_2667, partial [Microbacterium laevaniformans OR221]
SINNQFTPKGPNGLRSNHSIKSLLHRRIFPKSPSINDLIERLHHLGLLLRSINNHLNQPNGLLRSIN